MRYSKRGLVLLGALTVLLLIGSIPAAAQSGEEDKAIGIGLLAVGAGLAVGLGAVGTGIAQSQIGPAVLAATAEDPKMFGKGLMVIAIPETAVIFGMVISLMLMFLTLSQI